MNNSEKFKEILSRSEIAVLKISINFLGKNPWWSSFYLSVSNVVGYRVRGLPLFVLFFLFFLF